MTDIHSVCGVVKYWFRMLPETVIPERFFDTILDAASKCFALKYDEVVDDLSPFPGLVDFDDRLAKIREVVHRLPRANFATLKRFSEHLDRSGPHCRLSLPI